MKKRIVQLCFNFHDTSIPLKDLIYDNYDLFNMNVYTNAFNPSIPQKGLDIWLSSKINKSKDESIYKYSCVTKEKTYNIQIEFDKNDYIDMLDAQCDCDNFLKNGRSCEHIYACLYDTYASKNTEVIKNIVNEISTAIISYKNHVVEFLKNNIDELDSFTTCGIKFELNRVMNNSLLERRINDSNNSKTEIGCYSELEKIIYYDLVDIGKLLLRIKYDIIEYNNAKLKKTFFSLCEKFDSLLDDIDNISKKTLKRNYSIFKSNPIMNLYFSIFSIEQICLSCSDKIKNKDQLYKDLKSIKDIILFNDTNVRTIAKNIENLSAKYNLLKMKYIKSKPVESLQNKIVDNYESEISLEENEYVIGNGLIDYLDDFIAGMPLEVLEAVRKKDIANGDDTEIMDKAIAERKRRDEAIRKEQERQQRLQEAEERKWRKRYREAAFFGLLSGLFDGLSSSNSSNDTSDTDYLMPWEEDLVKKGEYEPYHFEEEEMDEDDYYSEDD